MKALKVILLIILFVPLVVGFLGLQAGLDGLAALRPGLYLSALRDQGVFTAIPDLVTEAFAQSASGIPAVEREKIMAAIRETADPVWMEAQIKPILQDMSGYLLGKNTELTASLPVGAISVRFLELYSQTATSWELARARQSFTSGLAPYESLSLSDLSENPAVAMARQKISLGVRMAPVAGGGVILLIALAFLLAGGFVGGARWTAAACLVSGVLGIVVSLVADFVQAGFLAGFNTGDLPPEIGELVRGVATSIAHGVIGAIRLNGILFLGAGIALLILAVIVGATRAKRRAPAVTAQQPPATAEAGAGPAEQSSAG